MPFQNGPEAIDFIFHSRRKLDGESRGADDQTRDVTLTQRLLINADLPTKHREYAVITGSRGKGSTTVIMAKVLQHLGHTVGTITGPHLVSWYERIRVNGRAIPEADFLRILSALAPHIEALEATLTGKQYISPQGIFLAIALRWFDEQNVEAAVLEVGRGGRFDDISIVPNKLSLITPIVLEHVHYLGPTIERIAWHKSGIIKPNSYVYTVPQERSVLDILQAEAETKGAEFNWISHQDLGEYLGDVDNGIRMRLGRYGELTLSLFGRYQVENATLAVTGAGNMHGRLKGIPHGSPEYVERVRAALADVRWPGRCEKLQSHPAVYVDGAITVGSALAFVESVKPHLNKPVVTITGIPIDRDYAGVYKVLGDISDKLIITETDINPSTHFPDSDTALAAARTVHPRVDYAARLPQALEMARAHAGTDGTILIGASQMLVGESMLIWGKTAEVI